MLHLLSLVPPDTTAKVLELSLRGESWHRLMGLRPGTMIMAQDGLFIKCGHESVYNDGDVDARVGDSMTGADRRALKEMFLGVRDVTIAARHKISGASLFKNLSLRPWIDHCQ